MVSRVFGDLCGTDNSRNYLVELEIDSFGRVKGSIKLSKLR